MPRGRQQMKEHPGEVLFPATQAQQHPESFLLHRLSQVAISDTSKVYISKLQDNNCSSIYSFLQCGGEVHQHL